VGAREVGAKAGRGQGNQGPKEVGADVGSDQGRAKGRQGLCKQWPRVA
jgi:hypothetical protein